MSDNVGISLFALSVSAALVVPQALSYITDRRVDHNTPFKRVACISAPGKVLVAGGYLVLEHPNLGVSVATSSRFYTTIKLQPHTENTPATRSCLTIVVDSPQFYTQYTYVYNPATNKVTGKGDNANPFVEKCVDLTMAFIKEFKTQEGSDLERILGAFSHSHYLEIVLQANNDFYSQIKELKRRNLPLLSSSLLTLPKFIPCPKDAASGQAEIAKTGLGSSAALTTSLVSALLQWFEVTRVGLRPDMEDRRVVHNLAQLVHANAQGKIGSGFDVAAAVYGTQMYRRFSSYAFESCLDESVCPETIYQAVMSQGQGASIPTTASVNALLDSKVMSEVRQKKQAAALMKQGWSQTIRPFSLPCGLDIVLGDVCGGSSSTSMARLVLKWRRDKPGQAEQLWDSLGAANTDIFDCLETLNAQYRNDPLAFNAAVAWASERAAPAWEDRAGSHATVASLLQLRALFQTSRGLLKRMGEGAGVGIEPDAQTQLCDATALLPGVVAAGVPGAGGVDAIFALTLSDAARAGVERMWSQWGNSAQQGAMAVCPLTLSAGKGLKAGIVAHFGGSENV